MFFEGLIFFGGFTYVAADMHARFGLSFSAVGLVVAGFGIGSLVYAVSVRRLVSLLRENGLVIGGGIVVMLGYLTLAGAPLWEVAPLAVAMLGLGYYMLHNTLQTHATQMLPEARGTGVAGFSSALFLGQSAGVALAAPIVRPRRRTGRVRAGGACCGRSSRFGWCGSLPAAGKRTRACRARRARSRRARCARPGPADCRRART